MKIFNTNQFILEIEEMRRNSEFEYIDAIVYWCEKNNVEVEYIASFIKKDSTIKSKLQLEAENLNIVKKSATLPI